MQNSCKNDGTARPWPRRGLVLLLCMAPSLASARDLLGSLDAGMQQIVPWLEGQGLLGMLLFGALDALLVILLLPVIVLAVAAGVVFGIVPGTLLMVTGTTTGATLAFLIGRYLLGARVRDWLRRRRHVDAFAAALREGGWLTIAALRMTPFLPFKSTNYVFGALELSLRDFVLGTATGILPLTAAAVTLGALAGDVSAALAARRSPHPVEWLLYGVGLAVAVAVIVTLTRRARRLLAASAHTAS